MERTASAVWIGSLRDGKGTLSVPSGVLKQTPYSFHTRFENAPGTNPEELVAAAHAGCFSMAFSSELGLLGISPHSIETNARPKFEKLEAGWTITRIDLDVTAKTPGADAEKVKHAAEKAKATCPISRILRPEIGMFIKVES